MTKQGQTLLGILPAWLRTEPALQPLEQLKEIRMRLNRPVQLVKRSGELWLNRQARQEDLEFCINAACRYSPWTAESAAKGFLTAPGGHRIGICGTAVIQKGTVMGLRAPVSLCIRVAKECRGIGQGIPLNENLIILGKPGSGKTTLLRDVIRLCSQQGPGSICVVDEREELFPVSPEPIFDCGPRTDILSGCSKTEGIEMALRTMGPSVIAVDEITAEQDCTALLQAWGCGVGLLATAHAAGLQDFRSRRVYGPLVGVFKTAVILQADQTWRLERVSV